jgi:hypothetical protein
MWRVQHGHGWAGVGGEGPVLPAEGQQQGWIPRLRRGKLHVYGSTILTAWLSYPVDG